SRECARSIGTTSSIERPHRCLSHLEIAPLAPERLCVSLRNYPLSLRISRCPYRVASILVSTWPISFETIKASCPVTNRWPDRRRCTVAFHPVGVVSKQLVSGERRRSSFNAA